MNSSSSSSASEPPSSASSISSLHRLLALECAFTFLTLADLSRIVRVCVEWRSLVHSMPSLAVTSVYPRLFQPLCASPLARHISRFDEQSMKYKPRGSHTKTLVMIAERMTALQSLRWELQRDALASDSLSGAPLRFPPALRELDLVLPVKATVAESETAMLALASLRHLQRLTLGSIVSVVSLRPLTKAASLRHLTIEPLPAAYVYEPRVELTSDQIDDVRSLAQLESVAFRLTEADWAQLLRSPRPANLRSFAQLDLVPAVCSALCDMPSVTSLLCNVPPSASFAFVSCLPALSTLELNCLFEAAVGPLLIAALESSPQPSALTDLNFNSPAEMDCACLSRILSLTPRLQRLQLHSLYALTSLSFLTDNPTLARTLTHFALVQCSSINNNERSAIQSLSALQSLNLRSSFRDPLTRNDLSQYAIGVGANPLWPHLREFIYESRSLYA